MGISFLSLFYVLMAFYGAGQIAWRRAEASFVEWALVGIAALTLSAFLANFFLPLAHPAVQAALFAVTLFGVSAGVRELVRHRAAKLRTGLPAFFLFLAFGVMGNRGWLHIDTGGYHFQVVKWIAHAPVPLGLGNFHYRYAFDSAWHLLAGLFWFPKFGAAGSFSVSPALGFVLMLGLWQAVSEPPATMPAAFAWVMFLLLTLFYGGRRTVEGQVGSPSTDFPAAAFFWLSVYYGLRGSVAPAAEREKKLLPAWLSALLSAFAKMSTAPLAIAILFLACERKRIFGYFLLIGAAFSILWMTRNFLLSGCWVFPVAQSCFPHTGFSMPTDDVRTAYLTFAAWARTPVTQDIAATLKDWAWFPGWWMRVSELEQFPLGCGALLLGLIGLLCFRESPRNLRPHRVLFAGVLVTWVYWFLQAPDLRYGYGPWFALPALILAGAVVSVQNRGFIGPKIWNALKIVALVFFVFKGLYKAKGIHFHHLWEEYPKLPSADLVARKTQNGFAYLQPKDGACWDAPLNCTPTAPRFLCVRQSSSGRLSFSVDPSERNCLENLP